MSAERRFKAWCVWCRLRITWRVSKGRFERTGVGQTHICPLSPGGRWHDPDPDRP